MNGFQRAGRLIVLLSFKLSWCVCTCLWWGIVWTKKDKASTWLFPFHAIMAVYIFVMFFTVFNLVLRASFSEKNHSLSLSLNSLNVGWNGLTSTGTYCWEKWRACLFSSTFFSSLMFPQLLVITSMLFNMWKKRSFSSANLFLSIPMCRTSKEDRHSINIARWQHESGMSSMPWRRKSVTFLQKLLYIKLGQWRKMLSHCELLSKKNNYFHTLES